MENQMTILTISDELYDDVVIYKLFSNPILLETLKEIENVGIFTAVEDFYFDNLKVCIYFFINSHILTYSLTK